ncbi:hypothetical protein SNE40_016057 [Patella caerulea]|uniref:ZP domain-containing protein n=1 Tax=Patella caerulea TaxID=87958 RepID=A0AAN8JA85_PATCE
MKYTLNLFAGDSTRGKDFYVAFFPETYESYFVINYHNSLLISSNSGGVCSVSYDNGTRHETTLNVNPKTVTTLNIPELSRIHAGTKIINKGVHVKCSQDVSLYGVDYYHTDGVFTAIPLEALSADYIVPGMRSNSFLGIVGTTANTTVHVYVKSTCSYLYNGITYQTGDVFVVLLQENDVLQITDVDQSSGDGCDLSGTRVMSTAKVSVFSGSVYYPGGASHYVMQVPPLSAYSKLAIAPRVKTTYAWKSIIRVVAGYDNTTLFNPAPVRHLDKGEYVEFNYTFTDDHVIISDKPVMVTQVCVFGAGSGFFTFVPGPEFYGNDYFIKGITSILRNENPYVTIISETKDIHSLLVDDVYPDTIQWVNLTNAPYSVGVLPIKAGQQLHILNSKSPIFVREHEYSSVKTHGYIGGYSFKARKHSVDASYSLECLASSFLITFDILVLGVSPNDIFNIYMGVETCTGILDGDILTFNTSYSDCHTGHKIENDTIYFENHIVFAPPSPDHLIRTVQWDFEVVCSKSTHDTDSILVHPKYNSSSHVTASGQIQGSHVKIDLYQDAGFSHILQGRDLSNILIGSTVFVQVTATGNSDIVMVVNNCYAHVDSDQKTSHQLIKDGCTVDFGSQILITRNQVTRFQFNMFDLPHDQNGFIISCDVTYCDPMDFTSKCQQTCHQSQPDIIG